MRVVLHEPIQELRRRWRQERDARRGRRLQAVVLAAEGRAAGDIAPLVGMSMRRVQGWVRRYNEEGVEGLARRSGGGRQPLLNPEEIERLRTRLEAPPQPQDGVCTLRAKDVQRILATEFGKVRKLGAVYYLLHQLGYESLAPRPRHCRSDPAAQEAFKKTSRTSWPRSMPSIPTGGSKSISRMKRGSVNRER
jgi:transposase